MRIRPGRAATLTVILFLSTTSFTVVMAVYGLFIRRVGLLRFLFGMKPGHGTPVFQPRPAHG